MAENKKDISVDYNNGNPIFNPTPGKTDLNQYDWVTVKKVGFPAEASVAALKFFHNQENANGQDEKNLDDPAGSWTPDGGPVGLTAFSVDPQIDGTIKIEDEEDPGSDDKYWFSVKVDGPDIEGGSKTLDPELINKKTK